MIDFLGEKESSNSSESTVPLYVLTKLYTCERASTPFGDD